MNDPVVVVATVRPRAEERDSVLASIKAAVPLVIAEDEGCELYAVHDDGEDFIVIEKWSCEAALQAHVGGKNFTTMMGALQGKLAAELEVRVVHPVTIAGLTEELL